VDYYQRIGRAGRAVDDAVVVLLSGDEDDEIVDYFIESAFPSVEQTQQVIAVLEQSGGSRMRELQAAVNFRKSRLEQVLKLLEVDGAVYRDGGTYRLSAVTWSPDRERVERVTSVRRAEQQRMREFLTASSCLMEFLTRELDDPAAAPCGRCASCSGPFVPHQASGELTRSATEFLQRAFLVVEPRRQLATGKRMSAEVRAEEGRALCYYGDAGWGAAVRHGKYRDRRFSDELVEAAARLVREQWRPDPSPGWVTAVPSLRHPQLGPDFAQRLAAALGLPFRHALRKDRDTPEQKTMENSAHQSANVEGAFSANATAVMSEPVLLVDDMVDSRWTLTECAKVLREAGSGAVLPLGARQLRRR
jgi:ATP-dependent DNA helicase RecQ